MYDAWGNLTTTSSKNNFFTDASLFKYRGYIYDWDTGFYYLQSRYYDPEVGRFINADGQLNGGLIGYNMYAYCENNPVMYIDPDGTMPKWLAATLAIGAGVIIAASVVVALPAAACYAGFAASVYLGSATAATVATAATYVAGAGVALAAGAYTADGICNMETGETVLLDTVFQGNVEAYETGAFLTSMATAGIYQMAAMGNQMGVCFVAGTLVETENGSVPIEEITAGMLVYAHNPDTGETELKEVVQTFVRETNELVHIKVNGEEIITTPTHPFWVPQKGWTDAIQLRAGDRLQLLNGEYVIIEQVQHEILEAPVTVYNFEVEWFHTYFVGETSVFVHMEHQ